jgi:PHP-associated
MIHTPYLDKDFTWLRTNLHAHTTESDGTRSPQAVIDDYAARAYDVLMLSDHDKLTDTGGLESRGLLLIPGNEISRDGFHLLHVDAKKVLAPHTDRQQVINEINSEQGLPVLCHPNWHRYHDHITLETLRSLNDYLGIEIYNGVIHHHEGSPLATDKWDMLLSEGRKLWGFANDDSHRPEHVGVAWNMVQVKEKNKADVLEALKHGSFYASTGVVITSIRAHGQTITVMTENAQRITASVDGGLRIAQVDAPTMTLHVPHDAPWRYVRLECWGAGEAMAWTQPFYLSS